MVLEKLKAIISEQLNVEEDEITESTSFEELGADSLDIVELIMVLEEEFNLEIADEDAEGMSTIGDVVEYIKERT